MWILHIPRRVERELADAPAPLRSSLEQAIEQLRHDPRPVGCKKLKGRLQCWRIRVGSYRILYDVHDPQRTIASLKIGPRKDVYRFLR